MEIFKHKWCHFPDHGFNETVTLLKLCNERIPPINWSFWLQMLTYIHILQRDIADKPWVKLCLKATPTRNMVFSFLFKKLERSKKNEERLFSWRNEIGTRKAKKGGCLHLLTYECKINPKNKQTQTMIPSLQSRVHFCYQSSSTIYHQNMEANCKFLHFSKQLLI